MNEPHLPEKKAKSPTEQDTLAGHVSQCVPGLISSGFLLYISCKIVGEAAGLIHMVGISCKIVGEAAGLIHMVDRSVSKAANMSDPNI